MNARRGISAVAVFAVWCGAVAGTEPDQPTRTDAPAALAGSSSCRACHAPFYAKWATSHHGLAMQPFTADLAGRLESLSDPLTVRDRRYRVELAGERGWVLESSPTGERRYAMEHALGGKNVYYFLTPLERGRLQVLPVAFDVRRRAWFDTTGSAARGLMHFEDEVLDWHAPQLTFNTSCHGCHVSQFASNYDSAADAYRSTWAEPGISCETCHGPGGEHVKAFRGLPEGEKLDDIRIISTKRFSVDQTNAMCASCHAKSTVLTASFKPGDRFFDHYGLVGPENLDYYADGRDLGENYTYTSWSLSPCVKKGQLSCLHCHTSSGRYRFEENTNQACLPCHRGHVDNPSAHTHHPAESAGGKCVACHMPTSEFARMTRSDHSMRPPMPAATLAFKSPNACNTCHADHDAAWADELVRAWRRRDYQAETLRIGGLIEAARRRDWTRLPDMLAYLASPQREEVFAAALVRMLQPCLDERKWPALQKALGDASPLVRASAAEGLDGYLTPEATAALLRAAADEFRLVRVRAAASLAALPAEGLAEKSRNDLTRATAEFLALVEARPDDAAAHFNLGNYHAAQRAHDQAIACYERAVALQPDNVAPLVNASLVHNADGRNDLAEACLRRAIRISPRDAAAHLNLGLLLGEMNRPEEAEQALRAAFAADPQSATAAYNLAVLLVAREPAEAVEWSTKAVTIAPQPKHVYLQAFCQKESGRHEDAKGTLRGLVTSHPERPEAYALLGEILESQSHRDEAVKVYQQASTQARLPEAVRQEFAARAARLAAPPRE